MARDMGEIQAQRRMGLPINLQTGLRLLGTSIALLGTMFSKPTELFENELSLRKRPATGTNAPTTAPGTKPGEKPAGKPGETAEGEKKTQAAQEADRTALKTEVAKPKYGDDYALLLTDKKTERDKAKSDLGDAQDTKDEAKGKKDGADAKVTRLDEELKKLKDTDTNYETRKEEVTKALGVARADAATANTDMQNADTAISTLKPKYAKLEAQVKTLETMEKEGKDKKEELTREFTRVIEVLNALGDAESLNRSATLATFATESNGPNVQLKTVGGADLTAQLTSLGDIFKSEFKVLPVRDKTGYDTDGKIVDFSLLKKNLTRLSEAHSAPGEKNEPVTKSDKEDVRAAAGMVPLKEYEATQRESLTDLSKNPKANAREIAKVTRELKVMDAMKEEAKTDKAAIEKAIKDIDVSKLSAHDDLITTVLKKSVEGASDRDPYGLSLGAIPTNVIRLFDAVKVEMKYPAGAGLKAIGMDETPGKEDQIIDAKEVVIFLKELKKTYQKA